MTDHTAPAIRAAGLLAAACVACAGCSLLQSPSVHPAPVIQSSGRVPQRPVREQAGRPFPDPA